MWIQTSNEHLQHLYREDLMGEEYDPPGVSFSENGVAQVTQEVGELLIDHYDSITEHDKSE